MKVFITLVVLLEAICNLNEACPGGSRRGRNPRIIRTLPPVTEPVEQITERPTEQATEVTTTDAATTPVATEKTTTAETGEVTVTTPEATEETMTAEAGEVTTAEPAERTTESNEPATETPTEAAPKTTEPSTEPPAPTEPNAVEPSTKMIDPLTRPTSVHRFFKKSAIVKSTKDERTCADVSGICRTECLSTEYLRGRFQCSAGFIGCCVLR